MAQQEGAESGFVLPLLFPFRPTSLLCLLYLRTPALWCDFIEEVFPAPFFFSFRSPFISRAPISKQTQRSDEQWESSGLPQSGL